MRKIFIQSRQSRSDIFLQQVSFPNQWREADLQEYILEKLKLQKKSVQSEVPAKGGRCDVLTTSFLGEKEIFEVKRYLTRDNIYQALGQLLCYQQNLNITKGYIIGLSPNHDFHAAITTANYVEKSLPNIKVIFVDLDGSWYPDHNQNYLPFLRGISLYQLLAKLTFKNVVVTVILLFAIALFLSDVLSSRKEKNTEMPPVETIVR